MSQEFMLGLADVGNQNAAYLETIFALSNGHIGVRTSELIKQKKTSGNPGAFVNGFYDTHPITYGEWAYGYARKHQTIVKLPNIRQIRLIVDGESSDNADWSVKTIRFDLDMKSGVLNESYYVVINREKEFELHQTSFVSFAQQEIYATHFEITNMNFTGEISIEKKIEFDQGKKDLLEEIDPRVASSSSELNVTREKENDYVVTTENSQQKIRITHLFLDEEDRLINNEFISFDVTPDKKIVFDSFSLISEINQLVVNTAGLDFIELLNQQKQDLANFWQTSDIELTGDSILQKGIRFNLFHLFQNAGRNEKTNFAAKGLTGEGYEGHYFWDTELYMLPFFIYTQPEIAKSLLSYRHYILPQAKERASIMGQKGALFAWRTINGEEASAYYPAGTAQLHINADISYAFQLYERVTGDENFIQEKGLSVVLETAKFWLSYGNWCIKEGKEVFCINGVTGPDEYTALVNNNYYTNKMAQNNMKYAAELARRYAALTTQEIEALEKAVSDMYLPYDKQQGLIKQDDSFLEKALWPFEKTPKENYPLLLNYHPMIIYKYQVSKQADGLLAEMLFPSDYTREQILRDYEYYEKVTTHDSSLSRSIFSVLASRTEQKAKAYQYFMDTALMDLTDLQGNAKDGIHAANMGGSWLSMIYGFAGLTCEKDQFILRNHLPKEIKELKFKLTLFGNIITIELKDNNISGYLLEKNTNIKVSHVDNQLVISRLK
ncbi:glycoside hydrolase family 65 protein [Vagococcus carniphilus]|uniref:Family 65 glycosyl hydrolase n=1 Tax=Vagococcus carniphilus TaxID=218144 RepID=A0A430AYT6_9ENTE|nr:glycoside hydrolase family 65 protein [Vagococcus carniphilus]QNN72043.1 glycoside hydrolase family 65 protein [Vagococcus carniphilus]RSU13223.1 family 65 glycosyl hydrolase [Vagococcus carniphilus]